MKQVGIFACILSTVMCAPAAGLAQTLSVDWKFYGTVSIDAVEACFYDAKGVVRRPDGHVRVWTKCLLLSDLDSIDNKTDLHKTIIENSAQKVARYYVPPIATVETIDFDQMLGIVAYEETANISYIKPVANIFYELNCSERMLQELTINIQVNGKSASRNKPGDWKYVPPEGNGARLLKLLCSTR